MHVDFLLGILRGRKRKRLRETVTACAKAQGSEKTSCVLGGARGASGEAAGKMGLAQVIRDLASYGKEPDLVLGGVASVQSRVTCCVSRKKNVFLVCRTDSGVGATEVGEDLRGTATIQARDGCQGGGNWETLARWNTQGPTPIPGGERTL